MGFSTVCRRIPFPSQRNTGSQYSRKSVISASGSQGRSSGKLALCYLLEDKRRWSVVIGRDRRIQGDQLATAGAAVGERACFLPALPQGVPPTRTHVALTFLSLGRLTAITEESLSVCHLRYSHTGKRLKRVEHKEERELVKDIFISLCFLLFYVYMQDLCSRKGTHSLHGPLTFSFPHI